MSPMLKKDNGPDIFNSYRTYLLHVFLSKLMEFACLQQSLEHTENLIAYLSSYLLIDNSTHLELFYAEYTILYYAIQPKTYVLF